MANKVEWVLIGGDGKPLWGPWEGFSSRENARRVKKELEEDIFKDWNKHIHYPLHIVRREWALVDERKV